MFCLSLNAMAEVENTIVCSFVTKDADPYIAEFQSRGKCAYKNGEQVFVSKSVLSKLKFNEHKLAWMFANGNGWFFVKQDGSTIPTIAYDNRPDYFTEGFARFTQKNKVGFIDVTGKKVIDAKFQFAFPFRNGRAVVCEGYKEVRDKENTEFQGGLWGCIDKKGQIIFPIKYSKEKLYEKLQILELKESDSTKKP